MFLGSWLEEVCKSFSQSAASMKTKLTLSPTRPCFILIEVHVSPEPLSWLKGVSQHSSGTIEWVEVSMSCRRHTSCSDQHSRQQADFIASKESLGVVLFTSAIKGENYVGGSTVHLCELQRSCIAPHLHGREERPVLVGSAHVWSVFCNPAHGSCTQV